MVCKHTMRNGYNEETYNELIVGFLNKINSYVYR